MPGWRCRPRAVTDRYCRAAESAGESASQAQRSGPPGQSQGAGDDDILDIFQQHTQTREGIDSYFRAAWRVREDRFRSRSANSWLLGRHLHGKVLLTVAAGRIAYEA